ncbi:hypothetical protein MKW98_010946, partial [Papaver atlanticum]
MSSAREVGVDRSHEEEIIDMKMLHKTLVDSQTKLADSQSMQAETQANIQHEMMDILRSSRNFGSGNGKDEVYKKPLLSSEEGIGITGSGKKEVGQVPNDDVGQSSKFVKDDPVATYYPDRNEELRDALEKGDWPKLTIGLTTDSYTVLHLAIYRKTGKEFVEGIVKLTPSEVLEYKTRDEEGFTALHFAAKNGNTKAAEMIVNKNSKLALIRSKLGLIPLEVALRHVTTGQKEIVKYLYSVTIDVNPSPFHGPKGAELLCTTIDANFYDLALCLIKRFPELVKEKSPVRNMCALESLVRRPYAFRSGTKLTWWQNYIYSLIRVDHVNSTYDDHQAVQPHTCKRDEENPPERAEGTKAVEHLTASSTTLNWILQYFPRGAPHIKRVYKQKLVHVQAMTLLKCILEQVRKLFGKSAGKDFFSDNPNIVKVSINHGIIEFIEEFLNNFDFLSNYRMPHQNMLEMAVAERNELIVNFICQHEDTHENKIDIISKTDKDENTILHHAAKLATAAQLDLVSGVALQMQRELQWFKGVESILSENDRFRRNKDGHTAQFIFAKEHKDLMKKGEDWMKDTSGSCMIVGALIATVAFAAAFTVPGGNIDDDKSPDYGNPVFLHLRTFTTFAVADALALFSSITAVLMFLAIYTSRYAEMDFLRSLPRKLAIGLATLFVSMAAILGAFGAALFMVVGNKHEQALPIIVLFGCCPLALFIWLLLPLFSEIVHSTYSGSLFRKHRYVDPTLTEND